MSSALVTGGSGFIGTRLAQRLAATGAGVRTLDLLPPRHSLKGAEHHIADVRNALPAELGEGVSRIYNFAAVHRTPGHPPHEYYEANVWGALNVIALAEACDIREIVFTSSISVYGPSESTKTEQSERAPESDYGRSKLMAEAIHQNWAARGEGRKLVIVRPGVVFGPGERGNYTYLAKALKRGVFFYPGRTDTIKSGGYVDELLDTMAFALTQPPPVITYNFAYPQESTISSIVAEISGILGVKRRPPVVPMAPMAAAAALFEVANAVGLKNPVHRERLQKLIRSTRIEPGWLQRVGYQWNSDLPSALRLWEKETNGSFD